MAQNREDNPRTITYERLEEKENVYNPDPPYRRTLIVTIPKLTMKTCCGMQRKGQYREDVCVPIVYVGENFVDILAYIKDERGKVKQQCRYYEKINEPFDFKNAAITISEGEVTVVLTKKTPWQTRDEPSRQETRQGLVTLGEIEGRIINGAP